MILLASAAVLFGCGGTETPASSPSCEAQGTLQVELGTGLDSFQPVATNPEATVIFGPQGGYHIWTALRVAQSGLQSVKVTLQAKLEDGRAVGPESTVDIRLVESTDGTSSGRSGLFTFIDDPADVKDRRVVLTAAVVACGVGTGRAQAIVTARYN